jgi:hypothetical protein
MVADRGGLVDTDARRWRRALRREVPAREVVQTPTAQGSMISIAPTEAMGRES